MDRTRQDSLYGIVLPAVMIREAICPAAQVPADALLGGSGLDHARLPANEKNEDR
jgi:hypothetical protein